MCKKSFRVVSCALLLALSNPVAAQQAKKAALIGYLDNGTAAGSAELMDSFRRQMTQFNWIEGKNLAIEYRYAEAKGATRLTELAAELVGLKVDVIVVDTSGPALAAKKATRTIPIVMAGGLDPVAQGLSLAWRDQRGTSLGFQALVTI